MSARGQAVSVLAFGVFLGACASGGASTTQAGKQKCAPVEAPFTQYGPVFPKCAVDREARIVNRPAFGDGFRPSPYQTCYRAIIDVVIDEDGDPLMESAQVVRATNTDFANAVLKALGQARYSPAMKDGKPVRQLTQFETTIQLVAVAAGARPTGNPGHRPVC